MYSVYWMYTRRGMIFISLSNNAYVTSDPLPPAHAQCLPNALRIIFCCVNMQPNCRPVNIGLDYSRCISNHYFHLIVVNNIQCASPVSRSLIACLNIIQWPTHKHEDKEKKRKGQKKKEKREHQIRRLRGYETI